MNDGSGKEKLSGQRVERIQLFQWLILNKTRQTRYIEYYLRVTT